MLEKFLQNILKIWETELLKKYENSKFSLLSFGEHRAVSHTLLFGENIEGHYIEWPNFLFGYEDKYHLLGDFLLELHRKYGLGTRLRPHPVEMFRVNLPAPIAFALKSHTSLLFPPFFHEYFISLEEVYDELLIDRTLDERWIMRRLLQTDYWKIFVQTFANKAYATLKSLEREDTLPIIEGKPVSPPKVSPSLLTDWESVLPQSIIKELEKLFRTLFTLNAFRQYRGDAENLLKKRTYLWFGWDRKFMNLFFSVSLKNKDYYFFDPELLFGVSNEKILGLFSYFFEKLAEKILGKKVNMIFKRDEILGRVAYLYLGDVPDTKAEQITYFLYKAKELNSLVPYSGEEKKRFYTIEWLWIYTIALAAFKEGDPVKTLYFLEERIARKSLSELFSIAKAIEKLLTKKPKPESVFYLLLFF